MLCASMGKMIQKSWLSEKTHSKHSKDYFHKLSSLRQISAGHLTNIYWIMVLVELATSR